MNWLIPDLWGYLAGFVALIGSVVGLYLKGRGDGRRAGQARDNADYRKTRERMDHAEGAADDADAARERLRQRGGG